MDDESPDADGEDPLDRSGDQPEDQPEDQPGVAAVVPTGHPGVDRVLSSLEGIDERDVHEHVAVFEQAHGALRRALDDPGESPGESPAESGEPRD